MASKAPVLGTKKTVALDDSAFGAEFHESLVHASVRAELAARRQGTHATKTRGKVRGGGAKPWRQKGTGRARQGSIRAPHWTGGGIVFGPSPRSYTMKVNRKEKRAALRSALSVHAARGTIAVFDPKGLVDDPRTKVAAELLGEWRPAPRRNPLLVVLSDEQARAALAFRNIERVSVLPAQDIGVTDLIGAAAVLVSQEALDQLTARAGGAGAREAGEAGRTPAKKADQEEAA
jgi:large subunit ribosomal protein L4